MSSTIRIAINGFGRIGRNLFRLLIDHPDIEVIAINDLADTKTLSHLLKYDSIHGVLHKEVKYTEHEILVDNKYFKFFQFNKPEDCPWKELNIDFVVEATGKFKSYDEAHGHIIAGARKVILSAPSKHDFLLNLAFSGKRIQPQV